MPKRARNDTQEVAAAAASGGVPRPGQAGAFSVKAKPAPEPAQLTKPDSAQTELKEPTIAEIFGPGGSLEKCMPEGYEHRPSQLEMAEMVEAAFRQKRHAIVEAGTGTGKTLACLIPAIHQRAADADLIIVNHHLFFADLALKQDDFGSVLPEYGAVVFDEAHEIEDVASEYFGRQISNYRFDELGRDAEVAVRVTRTGGSGLLKHIARMRERAKSFFEAFPAREGRFPFDQTQRAGFVEQNREAYDALINALKSLEAEIASLPAKPEELLNIARRSMELRAELNFLFESSEGNFVYWFERRAKGVFVAATPIDVSALLRERLFEPFETIVLTSATLAVGGRFDFLKQRLGVNLASERVLESEFDFATQALLFIPATLPDVRDPAFPERAAQEIVRLLEISRGRAFCLFTSYGQMNDLYERVRTRVRFPLLIQGSAPRTACSKNSAT